MALNIQDNIENNKYSLQSNSGMKWLSEKDKKYTYNTKAL